MPYCIAIFPKYRDTSIYRYISYITSEHTVLATQNQTHTIFIQIKAGLTYTPGPKLIQGFSTLVSYCQTTFFRLSLW